MKITDSSHGKRLILATTWKTTEHEVWTPATVVLVARPIMYLAAIDAEDRLRLAVRRSGRWEEEVLQSAPQADRLGLTDAKATWESIDERMNGIARSEDWRRTVDFVVGMAPIFDWIRAEIDAEDVV